MKVDVYAFYWFPTSIQKAINTTCETKWRFQGKRNLICLNAGYGVPHIHQTAFDLLTSILSSFLVKEEESFCSATYRSISGL